MTYEKLIVAPSENIVRVFFRGPGQSRSQANLIDFERRLEIVPSNNIEGGISFCRLDYMSIRKLVEVTRGRDPELDRGLLKGLASVFLEREFTFYGNPKKPGHVN